VCTIGPATEKKATLEKLIYAGMDCARLNFSHGSHENHALLIKNIRSVAKKTGVPVAIMQDLQGPKIRIGNIKDEGVKVKKNDKVILTCGKKEKNKIPVQYKNLYKDVKKGNTLLIDDGLIELKVKNIKGKDIVCRALNNGTIKRNKGINTPDANISKNPITQKDKKDLEFGLGKDIDYVALSFVSEAKNIHDLRKITEKKNKNVKIVSKIERSEAVQNLEEIIEASDALMVARGDLALEVGAENVPVIQKRMIRLCNMAGKPVITATQMLQSMVEKPQPTRAEVSDIANAIFDHTDAIMLSNETAVGDYPVRSVKVFAKVAQKVENELKKNEDLLPVRTLKNEVNLYDALGYQTCKLAETIKADGIIVVTKSGKSARYVSKHHSYINTAVITPSEKVRNQLALFWGLNRIFIKKVNDKTYLKKIKNIARNENFLKKGEKAVILFAYTKEKHIVSTII
jgi:pyruvate kinase